MVNDLRKSFATSKVLRRGLNEVLENEGIPTGSGYIRFWNGIYKEVFSALSEATIKAFLLDIYNNCSDLLPGEREEIISMLQQSQTTLTEAQRGQIKGEVFY